MPPDKAAKRQGIVAAATRDRRKAEKLPPRAAEKAAKRQKQPPRAAKGFNLGCASLLSVCAESRFGKPRSFLKKVLIVAVRSCGCGVLIRGLQNLGASCEGERGVTFCIVQKVTKKHARGLRTSGLRGRFKALPEAILQSFPAARAETSFACKPPA